MTRSAKIKEQSSKDVMRKCIATGELCPKSEMLRFVIGPENELFFDVAGKLPGRGMWLNASKGAVETAVQRKLFSRAAKTQVIPPATLAQSVEAALVKRLISLIALARKSGRAVAGSTKVKDWIGKDSAAVLLQARDGSAREKSKIRLYERGKSFDCLTKSELGEAFGRDFAVHAALDTGGLAVRVIEEATRLEGFRPEAPIGA